MPELEAPLSRIVAGFKEPKTRLRKVSELFWQQVEASKETAGEPSLNLKKEVCEPERLLEGAPATSTTFILFKFIKFLFGCSGSSLLQTGFF